MRVGRYKSYLFSSTLTALVYYSTTFGDSFVVYFFYCLLCLSYTLSIQAHYFEYLEIIIIISSQG